MGKKNNENRGGEYSSVLTPYNPFWSYNLDYFLVKSWLPIFCPG